MDVDTVEYVSEEKLLSVEVGKFYQLTYMMANGTLSYAMVRPVTWVTHIAKGTLSTLDYIDFIVEIFDVNLKYTGRDSGKIYPKEVKILDIQEIDENVGCF